MIMYLVLKSYINTSFSPFVTRVMKLCRKNYVDNKQGTIQVGCAQTTALPVYNAMHSNQAYKPPPPQHTQLHKLSPWLWYSSPAFPPTHTHTVSQTGVKILPCPT